MRSHGLLISLLVILVGVAAGGLALSASNPGPATARTPLAGAAAIERNLAGIPQDGLQLGRPDAPYVLTVYADPYCVGCTPFYAETLPKLIERAVRPGRLRLILRPVTTPGAPPVGVHEAYAAAQQDHAWDYALLFDASKDTSLDPYRILGAFSSVDVDRIRTDAASDAVADQVTVTQARATESGLELPAFFLDPPGRGAADVEPLPLARMPSARAVREVFRRMAE